MNPKSFLTITFLAFANIIILQASPITITVYTSESALDFEGILVAPNGEDVEMLRNLEAQTSRDGLITTTEAPSLTSDIVGTWTITQSKPGRYTFYVADNFSNDDMGSTREWDDEVWVQVSQNGQTMEYLPAYASDGSLQEGRIWQVFDMEGQSAEITPVGRVWPYRRMVYGRVEGAATGDPMEEVAVALLDSDTGEIIDAAFTNASGVYFLFPPSGSSILKFGGEGVVQYSQTIFYGVAEAPIRVDGYVNEPLRADQIRFVLSWDKFPQDLDAHLVGEDFHISYMEMHAYNQQYFLDVDETNSYGPETITMHRPEEQWFTYRVHDYTNHLSPDSMALSQSRASLQIYMGTELLDTIAVPVDQPGTWWNVLRINAYGEIEILGTLE